MDGSHPLKIFLQLHLASDASAVLHLPHVIASLSHNCFLPSPHVSKWTNRINSLLHAKDPGARWSGLCLAYHTAVLSRDLLIEHSQAWMGVALPLLSKNEPLPSLKASIRLLAIIFSVATGAPEFQRQVATPNVPKFTTALIALAENKKDHELRVLILVTLAHLVPLFPTLHRASHSALSTLSFGLLNGSAPQPTNKSLLEAASRLYAQLHITGGKVGATNLWRKAVDETLTFGWTAFLALRTTFQNEGQRGPLSSSDEALLAIPLNLDRLRCCTVVLCDLLSSTVQRPVQLPLGPLVRFITTLLRCTKDDPVLEHSDPTLQAMETSVIPDIWKLACDVTSGLSKCAGSHLTPHLTRLTLYLTVHLEQKLTTVQRLFLLRTVHALLNHCYSLDNLLVPARLAKVILPSLSVILAAPPDTEHQPAFVTYSKNRKGKKRTQGYEGSEIFNLSRKVICPSSDDGKVLFVALDVMRLLLRNHSLSPPLHSVCSRVLISILLTLPQMSPTTLSPDFSLHENLLRKLLEISIEIGSGTTSVMSKSLGLVVRAILSHENPDEPLRKLEILLHPRMPPLLRSLPHVESLSFFRAEETEEEAETREYLGLINAPVREQDAPLEADTRMASPLKGKDVDFVIPINDTPPVNSSTLFKDATQPVASPNLVNLPNLAPQIVKTRPMVVAARPTPLPSIPL